MKTLFIISVMGMLCSGLCMAGIGNVLASLLFTIGIAYVAIMLFNFNKKEVIENRPRNTPIKSWSNKIIQPK